MHVVVVVDLKDRRRKIDARALDAFIADEPLAARPRR
jgi:hypothetical protein